MKFQFDHLVQFVDEPKTAIKILEDNGIHAVEGGVHTNRGTFNALSYFDLSYIEYLGTYDRKLVEQTKHLPHSLIETVVNDQFAEGFVRFAIRTTDIEGVARRFQEKGLTVNGPTPLSRMRPDGSVIDWRLLYAGEENDKLKLPFIIQWDESDEERRTDLTERGVIGQQDGITFSHVTFAVNDLNETVEKWADLLGLKVGDEYIDDELNARCRELKLSGSNLVFASPLGDGIVSEVIQTRGERPFQVVFTSQGTEKSFELIKGLYKVNKK